MVFRKATSENPAMGLWKESANRPCLEALVPTRGSQTTHLTTKQDGKKLDALSQPVALPPGKLSGLPWVMTITGGSQPELKKNNRISSSLSPRSKQVQTRTWSIHSHLSKILGDK